MHKQKGKQMNKRFIFSFSLLLKRTHENNGYTPDYAGFSIPKKFVVGYALDLNEHFRDLEVRKKRFFF